MLKKLLFVLLFISVVPAVTSAACPEPSFERFDGWGNRFMDDVNEGGTIAVENLEITVSKVMTDSAVTVKVLKDGSDYVETAVFPGREGMLERAELKVELNSGNTSTAPKKANITVYTPHRANLTGNVTVFDVLKSVSGRAYVLPNEESKVEIELNSTGDVEAKNIVVVPQFGNFEIIRSELPSANALCPGDTLKFAYTIKAPNLRAEANYTLYLNLRYSDAETRSEIYSFPLEIKPVILTLEKSVANSSLSNPGRELVLTSTLENIGSFAAYDVELVDLPPSDIFITEGSTSWKGELVPGQRHSEVYRAISDEPLICSGPSEVTYSDRYGNRYRVTSNETEIRFSPFIVVEKEISGKKWLIDPTKNMVDGVKTWYVDEESWWESGSTSGASGTERKFTLNRTIDVHVTITNRGNAIARGVEVYEGYKGLSNIRGTTSWSGELSPDEQASYFYTADAAQHGDLNYSTEAKYFDVDPASFNESLIEEVSFKGPTRICSKTLYNITFSSRDKFYGRFGNLSLEQPDEINVWSGYGFDFNFTLSANGSDSIYDVYSYLDVSGLTRPGEPPSEFGDVILEGQPLNYLPLLKAKYYPNETETSWSPTNASYFYKLLAPEIDEKTNLTVKVVANYTNFQGDTHTIEDSTKIVVFPIQQAYLQIVLKKQDISITMDYANGSDVGQPAEWNARIKNTGYAPTNITFNISLPEGFELASNETAWKGRVEYEVKRAADTLFVFSGNISWNGTLGIGKEFYLPMQIMGNVPGVHEIPYTVNYGDKIASGSIKFKVKGAALSIFKEISADMVELEGEVRVKLRVKNEGDTTLEEVPVSDSIPSNFEIVSGTAESTIEKLGPGEEVSISYIMKATKPGSYAVGKASASWIDVFGNVVGSQSEELHINVIKPEEVIEVPQEQPKLSRVEVIATVVFSIIVLAVIFKMLSLTRPVSK